MKPFVFIHENAYGFSNALKVQSEEYSVQKGVENVERIMDSYDLGLLLTVKEDLLKRREEYRRLKKRFAFLNIALAQDEPADVLYSDIIDDVFSGGDDWDGRIRNIFLVSRSNKTCLQINARDLVAMGEFDLFNDNMLIQPGNIDISHFKSIIRYVDTCIRPGHINKICLCVTGRKNLRCECSNCSLPFKPHHIPIKLSFNGQDYLIGWTRALPVAGGQDDADIAAHFAKMLASIAGAWASDVYSVVFKLFSSSIDLIFKDITRRQEEEERKEQREKLLLAGELAASISHEIKNPLSVISGLLQLFKDKENIQEGAIKKYADMGLKELSRIQGLLEEYLSTVKTGSIKPEIIDVIDVIDEFIVLLRLSMGASTVSIRFNASGNVPAIKVDVSQLKQVILNLVQNAVHAVEGSGWIEIRTLYDEQADRVLIEIEDNGVGIPNDCIDKIFKPFYTTKKNGTGLGLFLCRRLVIENGGGIEVDSKPGQGSKFTVWFPAHRD
ncbi:MAG: hypothetical protein HPY66_0811 [Firmicutes bacterium]|nr:hypothetical protein [Bacillota bacterium]MDI6705556.1 ATP-binding protein [Bacillota bacterium]